MLATRSKSVPLEAFCQCCPSGKNVRDVLQPMGFSLVHQMKAYPACSHSIQALPAQYHFRDNQGTEVLYLAGRDISTQEGVQLPAHQSRWWLYPGHSHEVYALVLHTLTARWSMAWFSMKEKS